MPFHDGEIMIQARAGVREEAEQVSKVISAIIKPAAVEFLRTQQLAIASTIAADRTVWASLLTGPFGFVQVLDKQTVQLNPFPIQNPKSKIQNLSNGSQIGLLVIDLSNRRRLRLNGNITMQQEEILQIQIQQSLFNCPKYIQTRYLKTTEITTSKPPELQTRFALNETDKTWLIQADTFFIASAHPDNGADASHRGGFPGFVQIVDSQTLLFPDYSGNNMFQTLGNLTVNPRAGLIFVDFEQGHTLQVTGQATILWETDQLAAFAGAQRLIQFSIEQLRETRNATPLRWQFGEYSPANPHF
ncbi:pyridoxamine 5'-phosphate oxidase family protein [Leptothermofonsia sichuanensis E412]|nr:pyridoxamine 5'-phosphate oxidase family protein [Leptothermofonsia sichuanensis E412]